MLLRVKSDVTCSMVIYALNVVSSESSLFFERVGVAG